MEAECKVVSASEVAGREEIEEEDEMEFLQLAIGDPGLPDLDVLLIGSDSEGF
ncbi:Hypothetical protein CINCED_3A022002 [Cinara cedri]|uniref:Uncharacterized protein n=1 Tax=Cinara cedri TaxID=506608 RepID=A0A5E4N1J1_9HEMI|nr:Hypothetical protein CINCED_3A022002 [Cinara cedri]